MLPGTLTPSIKVSSSSRRKVPHAGGYSLRDSLRTYRRHARRWLRNQETPRPVTVCLVPIPFPLNTLSQDDPDSQTISLAAEATPHVTKEKLRSKGKERYPGHRGNTGTRRQGPSPPRHGSLEHRGALCLAEWEGPLSQMLGEKLCSQVLPEVQFQPHLLKDHFPTLAACLWVGGSLHPAD